MPQITEEGRYRFRLVEWGIREANKSQSMAFSYRAMALAKLDGATETELNGQGLDCTGDIWFVGKTGQVNDASVQFLQNLLTWDGKAAALLIPPGTPGAITPCEFIGVVKVDDYNSQKGERKLRIDKIEGDRAFIPHPTGQRAQTLAEKLQARLDGTPMEPGGKSDEPQATTSGEVPF